MTSDNFAGADGSLQAHQIEMGAFAQGYYFGFDRPDFIYRSQVNLKTSTHNDTKRAMKRHVHSQLSCNVFIPWDTKCVMYGYQALFAQDCTKWDESSIPLSNDEFYDVEVQIGNNLDPDAVVNTTHNPAFYLYQKLAHNRYADQEGGTTNDKSPIALEESFRYVSKQGMITGASAPTKGYLQVRVTVGASIFTLDPRKSKIKTPSGSIWLVALR